MSHNYGLTDSAFEEAKKKLAKQKDYLERQTFLSDSGEVKSLLDFSFSANLSKRYFPRILNKVHTFVDLAVSKDLYPVFLTVTLDGFFRDMMQGNYTRFTPDLVDKYRKFIPNNDRNGYYWNYIRNGAYSDLRTKKSYGKKLTPRDLYKILSHQMHRFTRSKSLQDIRQKFKSDYMSIRVTEPHKDGVPHFHVLMYLPKEHFAKVYIDFHRHFPAPRNAKKITMRDGGRVAKEVFDGHFETHGFQTEIRSPVGYILKYILKSFVNLIEGKELDYLQAWYIYNKIPRIITTHSLVAQDVYYHAALLDDDWYYQTELKLYHKYERNTVLNTFLLSDGKRSLIFENGYYRLENSGKTIKEFGINKNLKLKFTVERPFRLLPSQEPYKDCIFHKVNLRGWRLIPKKRYKYKINQPDNFVDIVLPNGNILLYDKETGDYGTYRDFAPTYSLASFVLLPGYSPKPLSDLDLLSWFYNFDIDKYGSLKFGVLKKCLIDRGLLEFEPINLNDYNERFDYEIT